MRGFYSPNSQYNLHRPWDRISHLFFCLGYSMNTGDAGLRSISTIVLYILFIAIITIVVIAINIIIVSDKLCDINFFNNVVLE